MSLDREVLILMVGRITSLLLLACVFLGTACSLAFAAPGDVDRFFGREGEVKLEGIDSSQHTTSEDMAVAPGGSIYVLRRTSRACCESGLLVTRLGQDGLLDRSFGIAGQSDPLGYSSRSIGETSSLAVLPDGKIVVATTDDGAIVVARLNSDGSRDGSFGAAGATRTTVPGLYLSTARIALRADGRVFVGAESGFSYQQRTVVILGYTPHGALDSSFNGGAPVFADLGSGLGDIATTSDSEIAIGGPLCCVHAGRTVHVSVLDGSGALWHQFGNQGQRYVDDVTRSPRVAALIALPHGKIEVVGSGGIDGRVFALRLSRDGSLDRTFGRHGIVRDAGVSLRATAAAVDGEGRLVVAGLSPFKVAYPHPRRLALMRRLADGGADRTFAGGLLVRLGTDEEVLGVPAIGLQPGGRIVTLVETGTCERSCRPPTSLLVRYHGGPARARCLGRKATIVGTRNADRLDGTPRRDVIAALAGNDVVRGRGGNDLICGGHGGDRLVGGGGRDRLLGGAGRNHIEP